MSAYDDARRAWAAGETGEFFDRAYSVGYQSGVDAGYEAGFRAGRHDGWHDAIRTLQQEWTQ